MQNEDRIYQDWLRSVQQNPPGLPPDADPYTKPGMFPANTVSGPVDMRNIRAMQGAPPVPRTMSPEDFNSMNPFERNVMTYGLNEQALKGYLADRNPMPPITMPSFAGGAPTTDSKPLTLAPTSGRSFRERIQHLPPSQNVEVQPPQEAPSIGSLLDALMERWR